MKQDPISFEPKSKHFLSESPYSGYEDHSIYANFFLEDVGNLIMPYDGIGSTRKSYKILVTPEDDQNKAKVNLLFPSKYLHYNYLYSPLEKTIPEFIEETAKRLIVYGKQYYEIIPACINPNYLQKGLNLTAPAFVLQDIPGKVHKIGNIYIQVIPRKLWRTINKKYIIIPSNSIWQIGIPTQVGGRKKTKEMLDGLFLAGAKDGFAYNLLKENLTKKDEFDFASHQQRLHAYIAGLTSAWGWNIRFDLEQYINEYYFFYREIISAYTLAILREHILKEMNILLGKIGYSFQISMDGIPDSNELLSILSKMRERKLSFKEVREFVRLG